MLPRLLKTLTFIVSVLFVFSLSTSSAFAGKSRGAQLFKLCVSCHGPQAQGDKTLEAPPIAGLPSWYIEAQLKKFQKGARGKHPSDTPGMRMRPMIRFLRNESNIKAVSEYVSKLEVHSPEMSVDGNISRGAQSYATCATCHGENGEGNEKSNSPPFAGMSDWYILRQLQNFKYGVRGFNSTLDPTGASMAPMTTPLSEQDMRDVSVYILSISNSGAKQ